MKVNEALLRTKMDEYRVEMPAYQALASFLRKVLDQAGKRLGLDVIVQGRVKSPASYAEKVVRKQDKFAMDAAYSITDKCGLRVICQSNEDRQLMCDYIRKNFLIDEANSLDKRSDLNVDAFGYLSVHFVVQIRDTDKDIGGIRVPSKIVVGAKGQKAEIQVRTLLEHAWATGVHDRFYKTVIRKPDPLLREAAGLASALEAADARYSRLNNEIDAYLGHYAAYLTKDEMASERAILTAACKYETNPHDRALITVRLARLARLSNDNARVIQELEKALRSFPNGKALPELRAELGYSLCLAHESNPAHAGFHRGQELLKGVADEQLPPHVPEVRTHRLLRAEAAHRLAWCRSLIGDDGEARKRYRQARELAPDDPYHLAAYIEQELFCDARYRDTMNLAAPLMRTAINRCYEHIAVGIELPRAYFTIARLHVFLDEFKEAFSAYLYAVDRINAPDAAMGHHLYERELRFFQRINHARELPETHEILRRLLILGQAVLARREGRSLDLPNPLSEAVDIMRPLNAEPVLILVGGASAMNVDEVKNFHEIISLAIKNSSGAVICGGTTVGIPGAAGKVAASLRSKKAMKSKLIGYTPRRLPVGLKLDKRYDCIFHTRGIEFNVLESLQAWTDLLQSGIDPTRVRLLGINGGPLSALDYRLALALGAHVGIIEKSGREADAIFRDPSWKDHPRLLCLPREVLDEPTMRAFVHPPASRLNPEQIERLAQMVHEAYVREHPFSDVDPSHRKYEHLRDDLKESNRRQVINAADILATEDYEVIEVETPSDQIILPVELGADNDEIDRMAALEHGRWNIERLSAGWRKGPRDVANKVTPYLVPYDELPDHIKENDRKAIRNFAKLLAQAGYQVVKKKAKS